MVKDLAKGHSQRETRLCVYDDDGHLFSPFPFFLVTSMSLNLAHAERIDDVNENVITQCIEIYGNEMKRRILDLQTTLEAELDLENYFLSKIE